MTGRVHADGFASYARRALAFPLILSATMFIALAVETKGRHIFGTLAFSLLWLMIFSVPAFGWAWVKWRIHASRSARSEFDGTVLDRIFARYRSRDKR